MKIDRLLAITIYLLNRDIVTGKELSEKFEVSERTIQRDIESINMSGIPIRSQNGVGGGYQIMDTFKLSKTAANKADINNILTALSGLKTALDSTQIDATIEKMKSIASADDRKISLDFSAVHENKKVSVYLKEISKAIKNRNVISLTYVSAEGAVSKRELEPLLLKYKWYTWYLAAFCLKKRDYRLFKLARIKQLDVLKKQCGGGHPADEDMFETLVKADGREYIDIKLLCKKKAEYVIDEYIPNCKITEIDDESFYCSMHVPENERFWYAVILSLGDDVKIIEPDILKNKIYGNAKKMINLYKDDI